MREILTYGSVFTTSAGVSGSPGTKNWADVNVVPIFGNVQGKVTCNTGTRVYRVDHPVLEDQSSPLITLTIPTSSSQVFVQGIFDVQSDHFYITLSDIPSETGYIINWTLGNAFNPKQAIDALSLPNEAPGIECTVPTSYPSIFNYESNV
jgi:hypothetical protein